MTRINQHYIPQFLLRGFSVRLSRKGNKVWVTKREGIPFQTATRNIASEHDFLPNELDRQIGIEEAEIAPIVEKFKNAPDGADVSSELASKVILHFFMRTKHFREALEQPLGIVIEKVFEHLGEVGNLKKILDFNPDKDGNFDLMQLVKQYNSLNGIKEKVDISLPVKFDHISPQIEHELGKFVQMVREFKKGSLGELGMYASNAHAQSFDSKDSQSERKVKLKEMNWKVFGSEKGWILPDCVVVSNTENGMFAPYSFSSNEDISQIYLPLCATKILLGYYNEHQLSQNTQSEFINAGLSNCALQFIISAERQITLDIQSNIGTWASHFARESREIVSDLLLTYKL